MCIRCALDLPGRRTRREGHLLPKLMGQSLDTWTIKKKEHITIDYIGELHERFTGSLRYEAITTTSLADEGTSTRAIAGRID